MTVIKVIELVGVSEKGLQDAVEIAVKEAAKTVINLRGVDVVSWTGKIKGDKVVEYSANVKISFAVDDER